MASGQPGQKVISIRLDLGDAIKDTNVLTSNLTTLGKAGDSAAARFEADSQKIRLRCPAPVRELRRSPTSWLHRTGG
jgi:hypothetical protein